MDASRGSYTGDPGPAQNSEFHQYCCCNVPLLGSSWSISCVKKLLPVIFEVWRLAMLDVCSHGVSFPIWKGPLARAVPRSEITVRNIDAFMIVKARSLHTQVEWWSQDFEVNRKVIVRILMNDWTIPLSAPAFPSNLY